MAGGTSRFQKVKKGIKGVKGTVRLQEAKKSVKEAKDSAQLQKVKKGIKEVADTLKGKSIEETVAEYSELYTEVLLGLHRDLESQGRIIRELRSEIESLKAQITTITPQKP